MYANTRQILLVASCLLLAASDGLAADGLSAPLRAGIIGVDAHALPWTRILNDPQATGELADMVVVAAFPGGSPHITQSMELLKKLQGPVAELGVEMVDSIEQLLSKVDVVMVLSIDGGAHLEQVRPVIAAGKPLFVDKPMAGNLADVIEIYRLARANNVPCWSSSSLRYGDALPAPKSTRNWARLLAVMSSEAARGPNTIRTSTSTASTRWRPCLRSWARAARAFNESRPMQRTWSSASGKAAVWGPFGTSEAARPGPRRSFTEPTA